jgi:non-heme chloroperoxidase
MAIQEIRLQQYTEKAAYLEVRGTRIAYSIRGDGAPVVFVHGALGDLRTWEAQTEALAFGYRGVSYSRRYHFPDEWDGSSEEYEVELHAADLAALLTALDEAHGLGPVHLVGHSYGGTVALRLALEHPSRVRSLVLAEPSAFGVLRHAAGAALLDRQQAEFKEAARLLDAGQEEAAVREYVRIVMGADAYPFLPEIDQVRLRENARTLGPMLRTYHTARSIAPEEAREVRVPALLVAGSHSPPLYRRIAEELRTLLPRAEMFTLQDASHGLHMEQPEAFNAALTRFLDRQRLPTEPSVS